MWKGPPPPSQRDFLHTVPYVLCEVGNVDARVKRHQSSTGSAANSSIWRVVPKGKRGKITHCGICSLHSSGLSTSFLVLRLLQCGWQSFVQEQGENILRMSSVEISGLRFCAL